MKGALYKFTFIFFILLLACEESHRDKSLTVISTDTLLVGFEEEGKSISEKIKKIEEQEYADSIRLDNVLKNALEIAYMNIDKKRFLEKYEFSSDSMPVSVEINLSYHFTKKNPHLIIRREEVGYVYIDIYAKCNNKFEKVVSHKQWTITYVRDTIQDINGDGLKDFVVHWYGSAGCCLKAFSNVYLLRSDRKTFLDNIEFINPTFSPQEKVVRGVCYGHPGETELYKYKWNGSKIDTLEYVSYEKNDRGVKTGNVIISTQRRYTDGYRILIILKNVPKEYTNILGYDWFTGDGYD